MYECIRVKMRSSAFPDSLINEEGDLKFEKEIVRNKAVKFVNRMEKVNSVFMFRVGIGCSRILANL